jgi:imidazole glycerol-phosphate synthase subunit HisH
MVVILDYGMGNLGSHINMMRKVGFGDVIVSAKRRDLEKAEKIIIPGVGAFDTGMNNLKELDLIEILRYKALEEKIPVLGICLGMHLFATESDEGKNKGLGWIDSKVVRFNFTGLEGSLKIPHMGWNIINLKRNSILFNGMEDVENRFYFVHSYHFDSGSDPYTIASCNYGYDFPAVIQSDNIFGVQFHPEKSHNFGIKLYKNFIES